MAIARRAATRRSGCANWRHLEAANLHHVLASVALRMPTENVHPHRKAQVDWKRAHCSLFFLHPSETNLAGLITAKLTHNCLLSGLFDISANKPKPIAFCEVSRRLETAAFGSSPDASQSNCREMQVAIGSNPTLRKPQLGRSAPILACLSWFRVDLLLLHSIHLMAHECRPAFGLLLSLAPTTTPSDQTRPRSDRAGRGATWLVDND